VAQPGDAFAASVLRPRSDVMTGHRVRLRGGVPPYYGGALGARRRLFKPSHTKLEDTKPEHLELSVQALDRLATKTIARCA
jgi:hypothetical protein